MNAIKDGYDSVMIDGSRVSFQENIEATSKIVELAHSKNITVEAELGSVFGHEKDVKIDYEELFSTGKGFTDVEEAKRFVKETKVDMLSVAIGNIYGAISGVAKNQNKISARLNISHLKRLNENLNLPLVIHGDSGIKKEYIIEAIKNGITKINIGTDIRQTYEEGLRYSEEKAYKMIFEKVKEILLSYFNLKDTASFLNH